MCPGSNTQRSITLFRFQRAHRWVIEEFFKALKTGCQLGRAFDKLLVLEQGLGRGAERGRSDR
jgi:hypothetical protein